MVEASKHGQGIGTQLLKYRLDAIHQQDPIGSIKLCTSQHTVEFYKKHGFKVTRFIEKGYGKDFDQYVLEFHNEL